MDASKDLYFLSYSRKHFYLAEWLVVQLQAAGFDVWFDVQQLTPGIHWAPAIDDGLSRCAGVILIASQAAIVSPYVEKEWSRAQDDGKRVCVCVVEDVELPERLLRPDVTVIDMRARFDPGVKRVMDFLNGKPVRNDQKEIHNSLRLGIRWAVPGLILCSILAWRGLAVISVLAGMLTFLELAIFGIPLSTALPAAVYLYCGVRFWRWANHYAHRNYTSQESNTLILPIVGVLGASIADSLLIASYDPGIGVPNAAVIPIILILMLVAANASDSVIRYRWAPTCEVVQAERTNRLRNLRGTKHSFMGCLASFIVPFWGVARSLVRYLTDVLPPVRVRAKELPHPVRYTLLYEPRESYLARRVGYTMKQFGHTSVDDPQTADYQLVIISDVTPTARLEETTRHTTPPIFILAAPINLDSDSPAAKFQWLDYRRRSQNQLNLMARLLKPGTTLSPEERFAYGENFLPLTFQSRFLPQPLYYVLVGYRVEGPVLGVAATCVLALSLRGIAAGSTVLECGALLITGVILIGIEDRIRRRKARLYWAYMGTILAYSWIFAGIIGLIVLLNALVPEFNLSAPDTISQVQNIGVFLNFSYGALLILLGVLLATVGQLRLWLPAPGLVGKGPYLAVVPPKPTWLLMVIITAIVAVIVFVLLVNFVLPG